MDQGGLGCDNVYVGRLDQMEHMDLEDFWSLWRFIGGTLDTPYIIVEINYQILCHHKIT